MQDENDYIRTKLDNVSKNSNEREDSLEKKSIFLQNHKIVTLYSSVTFEKKT
ncbi:hypothetical protein HSISM1_1035 [Streptococcus sp. HSISM1]|nr:hypothetical protein HSISM1_1035 [Streptococcus sp. HSISM1]